MTSSGENPTVIPPEVIEKTDTGTESIQKVEAAVDDDAARQAYDQTVLERTLSLTRGNFDLDLFLKKTQLPIQEEKLKINSSEKLEDYEQRVMKYYDEGFAMVMEGIPDVPDHTGTPTAKNILAVVKEFKRLHTVWAGVRDRKWMSLHEGRPRAAIGIIGPKNPRAGGIGIVQMDDSPDAIILMVGPYAISKPWAGIALTNGISYLIDRVTGQEPKNPTRVQYLTGQMKAIEKELLVVGHMSKGNFYTVADDILKRHKVLSVNDFLARHHTILRSSASELDKSVTAEPSQSEKESVLRKGFYVTALLHRLIGLPGLNVYPEKSIETYCLALEKLIIAIA